MRLRLVNALVYAALAVFASATLAPRFRDAFAALVLPYAHASTLRLPGLWLVLAFVLAGLVALAARRLLLGESPGRRLYVALLLGVATSVAATRLVPNARRPDPREALDHLLARTEGAADAAFAREGRYPADAGLLTADWPPLLRETGFRARPGVLLESRLHVVPGATGPVLRATDAVRPGDLVFALSADARRYWLSAFVLDPVGRVKVLSSGGRTLVVAGADGKPSIHTDPLFPEYPHRKAAAARRPPGTEGDDAEDTDDPGGSDGDRGTDPAAPPAFDGTDAGAVRATDDPTPIHGVSARSGAAGRIDAGVPIRIDAREPHSDVRVRARPDADR